MSVTKVTKSQLSSIINDFSGNMGTYNSYFSGMASSLRKIPDHSDFSGVSEMGSTIASSLDNIYVDLELIVNNIKAYVEGIIDIDGDAVVEAQEAPQTDGGYTPHYTAPVTSRSEYSSWTDLGGSSATNAVVGTLAYTNPSNSGNYTYSFSSSPNGTVTYTSNFSSNLLTSEDYNVSSGGKYNYPSIEKYLETEIEGVTVTLPAGLGSVHTYMGWQCVTAKDSKQYKLREAAGMNFDEEGFAKIGDRYVIACTTTFGNVGDFIDVYQEDGTVIKCVIGDIKSQSDAGCTEWGHNNGHCVIEFVVDKRTWYGDRMHVNPGTQSCHPEWNQNIVKIVNKGNFFEHIKTDAAQFNESTDNVTTLEYSDANDGVKVVTLDSESGDDVTTNNSEGTTTDPFDNVDPSKIITL